MPQRISFIFALFFLFITSATKIFGQPNWSIHLLDSVGDKKPKKFEEFKLGSEKSADKKFSRYRRFVNNTITHYNYYYDANNKILAVVERAKSAQKDDYNKLLSFYPYSLENTALQKKDLDSIILKCTAGILLHDLRNDWVDNMYLLLGESYFYRKDFDSAAATFQFINYNLFPRQKDEDDNRVVGTNSDASKSAISIANPEKQNFAQKIFSQPPSRNDALIWLTRSLIEQGEYGESAGLISTLQTDPNLPPRLKDDVEEADAYWFFQQNIYDSAATHLEKALTNADTKEDKARWEYLLAELFEMTHQPGKASMYYDRASKNTVDPLMDIHAQLNNAKMLKSSNPEELDKSINNLLHMAKQDKFDAYRDIIYFSAAQLALQKPDTTAAILYDNKSIHYNENNVSYKNKAYLQLADIAFNRKDYRTSFSDYDSLQTGDTTLGAERLAEIQARRNTLSKIVEKLNIIDREDSLQNVAAMAPADRDAFVKKLAKKLQKEKGIKEDEDNSSGTDDPFLTANKSPDLFTDNTKGEWYFYNSSLKTKGFSDFKARWGKRDNADNWQRKSAVVEAQPTSMMDAMPASMNPDEIDTTSKTNKKDALTPSVQQAPDLSFVGLMSNLPLTQEKLNKSNTLVAINLFELAKLYQDELQDYQQAIVTYQQSLNRFPDSLYNGEIYLGLYFCYNKLGNTAQAEYYKNLLNTKFAGSKSSKIATDPTALKPTTKDPVATKRYEEIYNLFIEGDFVKALDEKKTADSLYSNNYWSPQLLYIQSIYYIKEVCNDSLAKASLKNLVKLYPSSPMKPKAQRMIDVLNKRAEIEAYLTNLKVTRAKDDEVVKIDDEPVKTQMMIIRRNPTDSAKKIITPLNKPAADTVKKNIQAPPPVVNGSYAFDSTVSHNLVMLLDKVDPTFVNEAKNAIDRYNGENFYSQKIIVTKEVLNSNQSILVFSSFANANAALQYYASIKKAAPDEISWLPPAKYSFFIISDANLQVLRVKKDALAYKKLLNTIYLNKF